MPITKRALSGRTRKVTLDFGDDGSLNVWYRPDASSLNSERELADKAAEASAGDAAKLSEELTLGRLLMLLDRWDLYDDEKMTKLTPITPETLRGLGFATLNELADRIARDMAPNPPTGASSAAGSGVNGATPPIGSFA